MYIDDLNRRFRERIAAWPLKEASSPLYASACQAAPVGGGQPPEGSGGGDVLSEHPSVEGGYFFVLISIFYSYFILSLLSFHVALFIVLIWHNVLYYCNRTQFPCSGGQDQGDL